MLPTGNFTFLWLRDSTVCHQGSGETDGAFSLGHKVSVNREYLQSVGESRENPANDCSTLGVPAVEPSPLRPEDSGENPEPRGEITWKTKVLEGREQGRDLSIPTLAYHVTSHKLISWGFSPG